jgi:RNA polymerase sigma-70 factor (ECF subfamily)
VKDGDWAVVERVRSGDTEAFRLLVDRHQGRLLAMLRSIVGDWHLAQELAQEAFVKAYTGLDSFRGQAGFGTWVVQIGLHAARDHLRRQARQRRLRIVSLEELSATGGQAVEPADPRPASNPLEVLAGREAEANLQEVLAELPAEYREVLVLKHFAGWSYERIAEATGDRVGTLKVRAHRARKLLYEKLSERGQWEPRARRSEQPGGG